MFSPQAAQQNTILTLEVRKAGQQSLAPFDTTSYAACHCSTFGAPACVSPCFLGLDRSNPLYSVSADHSVPCYPLVAVPTSYCRSASLHIALACLETPSFVTILRQLCFTDVVVLLLQSRPLFCSVFMPCSGDDLDGLGSQSIINCRPRSIF